jgi:RHS repeat-associated protein
MLDHDSESGTDHAQFRQYGNTQGRFMSPDPYDGSYDPSNPQSMNRYTYAMNNPLSYVDPSGMDWTWNGDTQCWDYQWVSEDGTSTGVWESGNCGGQTQTLQPTPTGPPPGLNGVLPSGGGSGTVLSDAKWNCEQNVVMGSLVNGVASALGIDGPPGSGPDGDLANAIKDAARNPLVQISVGTIAVQMGRILATPAVAARIGAFVSEEAIPFVGEAATVYVGYKAISAGVDYFKENIGACSNL